MSTPSVRRPVKKFATIHKFGTRHRKKKRAKSVDVATTREAEQSEGIAEVSPQSNSNNNALEIDPVDAASLPVLETSRSAEVMPRSSQRKRKHAEQSRDSFPSTSAISALERPRSRSAGEGGDPAPSAPLRSAASVLSTGSLCTSAKKLRRFTSPSRQPSNDDENVIISMSVLNELIGTFRCANCDGQLSVTRNRSEMFGCASKLRVTCPHCGITIKETRTSLRTGTRHGGFDVNRRLVLAANSNGIGFTQLKGFFAMMNLPPPMHLKTWQFYQKTVHRGVHRAADRHLQEAAEQVRLVYQELQLADPTPQGRLDISVSFDGSWHKRGRTSHNGIAAVIEIYSGLVVDFVTLSNYCHGCEIGPKPEAANHAEWERSHQANCQKNIHCSSQAMESEAALILWRRSEHLHNFRYMEMLGDGDGKAHTKVNAEKVYGEGVEVRKIDCCNHVTKRMGTALRNLVEKRKAQHAPIGGRGNLTDQRICKLTSYYGLAIKKHQGDLDGMINAVWASFFHTLSTDEDPRHDRCPASTPERRTWCSFKRALEDSKPPPAHPHPLPRDIAEALVPVYKRLGDPQLLKRCLSGKTQNSNESFHSLVWRLCPKERWAGLQKVDTAVAICIQRFNKGSAAHQDVLDELELVGELAGEHARKEDEARVKKATKKSSQQAQARRARLEAASRAERQQLMAQEGVLYSPGLE